ncbi:cupin domain-containing protein [Nocardia jejuensis]|uniref:cupin domain-containing protein n=1 Tax=Nocardia jejuensis TaxID=328049 RepID=UPI00083178BF|nr:cupin domain-containing protein [Nocardia jejuensis]
MPFINAATAEVHDMHGSRFTPLVRPSAGSAELCIWKLEISPATEGVAHRVLREEAFVLLDGEIRFTIAGETSDLKPGDAAFAPAGSTIRLDNSSSAPATVMVTAPVGFSGELSDGTIITPPWVS